MLSLILDVGEAALKRAWGAWKWFRLYPHWVAAALEDAHAR